MVAAIKAINRTSMSIVDQKEELEEKLKTLKEIVDERLEMLNELK